MTEKKYLCLQAKTGTTGGAASSPSSMDDMYARFNAWRDQYAKNIIDMGGRLTGPAQTVSGGNMIDGPLVEVRELIGGYMILAATDLEQARKIVQAMPGNGEGSSITLREIAQQ